MNISTSSYQSPNFGNKMAVQLARQAKSSMFKDGIVESIKGSMYNINYDSAKFDDAKAKNLIQSICDYFGKNYDIHFIGDVAEACVKYANIFTKSEQAKNCNLPNEVRDAIAATYLNRIAGTRLIDLALYPSDFYKASL